MFVQESMTYEKNILSSKTRLKLNDQTDPGICFFFIKMIHNKHKEYIVELPKYKVERSRF